MALSNQGTEAWKADRVGYVTASRVADIMAKTKSGPSASRANYLAEVLLECLTGQSAERDFSNAAMQWGTDMEPVARAAYEMDTGFMVVESDFVKSLDIFGFGCSPDGYIDKDGLIEIKAPNSATHLKTLTTGKIQGKYVTQMQAQMLVTGRNWCDYVSFDPRFPDRQMQLFVQRVFADSVVQEQMTESILAFRKEISDTLVQLGKQFKVEVDEAWVL